MNKKIKFSRLGALATILAISSLSWAAQPNQAPSLLDKCMDAVDLGYGKNGQFAACYAEELQRQDMRLNIAYKAAQGKAPAEARPALLKSQRAWIAFRDARCELERALNYAPNGEVNRVACLSSLTTEQATWLEEGILD